MLHYVASKYVSTHPSSNSHVSIVPKQKTNTNDPKEKWYSDRVLKKPAVAVNET